MILAGSSLDGFEDSSFSISRTFAVSLASPKSVATVDSACFGAEVFVMRTEADLGHFIPRGFDCFSNELTVKWKIFALRLKFHFSI